MGLKKRRNLKYIFIRYIVYLILTTVLLLYVFIFGFSIMLQHNIVLAANYSEKKIEKNRDVILKSHRVTENMIPDGCNYGVYDKYGKMLYGNFTYKKSQRAWNVVKNSEYSDGIGYYRRYYKVFYRNKEVCIIEYPIVAQFKNPFLRKYLINPEWLSYILFFSAFVIEVILLSAKFGKKFSGEMNILMHIADKIKKQDLNFDSKQSSIYEIDEVINSLNDMKIALKDSLEKQWNMEKSRKIQISALAHDIKTPLTIIKGNSELLSETCQDKNYLKYNENVLKSANEIEHYLKLLIDITKSENSIRLKLNRVKSKVFFKNIIESGKALAIEKNIQFIVEIKSIPEFFYADQEMLHRSIINVISNAVEYCPKNGKVLFKAYRNKTIMEFLIADSGMGFSKEELKLALQQFYRGDKSRTSKNHYGIGLYITEKFIKLHRGEIDLSNSKELGGAEVLLRMPLKIYKEE